MFLFLSVASVALFSFIAVASWADARRREREAYYKSETMKRLAELQGAGSTGAVELLREEERIVTRRRREGQRLGGLITFAVGIGFMVFLYNMERHEPVYLVGLVPMLVGAALLTYSYVLADKE